MKFCGNNNDYLTGTAYQYYFQTYLLNFIFKNVNN